MKILRSIAKMLVMILSVLIILAFSMTVYYFTKSTTLGILGVIATILLPYNIEKLIFKK